MHTGHQSPQQRILDVASRLFYAEGIHAVGVDRVVAEASVAKATLYAHFPSKADLVAAYLGRESRQWGDEAGHWVDDRGPGTPAAVQGLFDMLYEHSRSPGYRGCPFINAAAEFPGPGPVGEQIAAHRQRVRRTFALAGGALLAPVGMLDAIVALYGGAMSAAHLDHEPEVVHHAAAAAVQLLGKEGGPG